MMRKTLLFMVTGLVSQMAWALTPYLYGDKVPAANVQSVATEVESKLKAAGFKVVGKYFPRHLDGYGVVIATDQTMLNEIGNAGGKTILDASIRVGIKSDGTVSYTNPEYWGRAYFRNQYSEAEDSIKALDSKLAKTLGRGEGFGGDESAKSLNNYRYMFGMEKLDSSKGKLAEYGNFDEAVKAVRENLDKKMGNTAKVYEVVMPNKKLAVFGVALTDDKDGDGRWIKKIDMQENIAALPYEIIVVNNEVMSPYGRFRIALAFPDTGMGQFMRISSVPNDILNSMSTVANGKSPESDSY
jgi:hypothetical protein